MAAALADVSFYDSLLVTTLWPFGLLIPLGILCIVGTHQAWSGLAKTVITKRGFVRRSTAEEIYLFICYCVLPSIALNLAEVFECTKFPNGEERYVLRATCTSV